MPAPSARRRSAKPLEGLDAWLTERFLQHDGNADVVRQQLAVEHDLDVSLRTVERAVQPLRQRLHAARQATVPWTLVGQRVRVSVAETTVRVYHGAEQVACHARCRSHHQGIVDPAHVADLRSLEQAATMTPTRDSLVRTLDTYQRVVDGLVS